MPSVRGVSVYSWGDLHACVSMNGWGDIHACVSVYSWYDIHACVSVYSWDDLHACVSVYSWDDLHACVSVYSWDDIHACVSHNMSTNITIVILWHNITIVILWLGLLKQIINHNRSKFVLSKLVLTGVCSKHFMYKWMHRSCTLSCVHMECMSTNFVIRLLFNIQNSDNILLKYQCQIFLFHSFLANK